MSAEAVLRDVGDDERRDAAEIFQRLSRFTEVFFLQKFEFEIVPGLENAVERFLDPGCSSFRIGNTFADLRQFDSGRNPNLVPVIKVLDEFRECFVSGLKTRIFENTCIHEVLEYATVGRRFDELVILLAVLVQLVDDCGSVFC
ncbi:MAG: hypothetical protein AAF456_16690 [Planctomycetota bacterium]